MSENPQAPRRRLAALPKWEQSTVQKMRIPGGRAQLIVAECHRTGCQLEGYLEYLDAEGRWRGHATYIAPDGARFAHEADLMEHLRRSR